MATGMVAVETLLSKEGALKTFEAMSLARFSDEKMMKLVRQNKGGTFQLSIMGHEMIGVASGLALRAGKDWALPYYRDRAFAIGLGCSLTDIFAAFLGRDAKNHSGGRMMPDHFSQPELRITCQSSVVGSQFLQAVGVAKTIKSEGKDEVVYVSSGDGATSQGDFHEALNFACVYQLAVIFVIQDNDWAISVPAEEQTAGTSIAKRAKGYSDLLVLEIDGCDYEQVAGALTQAIEKARAQQGPSLLVAKVPRIGPHSNSDDPKKYKTEAHFREDQERDPLPRFEKWLLSTNMATRQELDAIKQAAFEKIEQAVQEADQVPFPDPESAVTKIFKDAEPIPYQIESDKIDTTDGVVMVDAINSALDEEMERDRKVVVFGQDVARGKGGVFRATHGLSEKYGSDRCFNTPLAESTIVGLCIGMSMAHGYKPVGEIQFCDYMWTGINQIVNELASIYYRSNGQFSCPAVIRMTYGGYIQGGPYHSQCVEGFLAHCPGLKIVIPSNASDAKRLMKAAIRDPNPVIFLEHKALYRQRKFSARKEPGKEALLPFGKACVVHEGSDVTLVGWGMSAAMGYEVAQKLAKENILVEVIDLRTIIPFDMQTILTSVKKTGKLIIAQEAHLTCGFGAELAARVSDEAFSYLDAPVKRIGAKEFPIPYSKGLEDFILPQLGDIEEALRLLAEF
jgi:2-oxoisovalerate dehydrogenase E1 component